VAENVADYYLNAVLTISSGPLLVPVRKDHELDRVLLQKQKAPAKKPKRGAFDDPICHTFGSYVIVMGDNGAENLCRFRKESPCSRCKRE
jgi:hypothetical protein